jgi:hypothetical protein
MGRRVRALGFIAALLLLVLAGAAALLASDVRAWQRTIAGDDARLATSPAHVTWQPHTQLPYSLAERLLGVRDDVAARQAIALFLRTAGVEQRLDNGSQMQRGRAEAALAEIARDPNRTRASQAETLLGVLVFTDRAPSDNPFQSSTGPALDQVQESLADFQNAVRDDPDNLTAKYNLELVIRTLAAQGVRVGSAQQSGAGSTGKRGAGGGVPGEGY